MFNIDPDNHFHASISTDTNTAMNTLSEMSNPRETYLSYILMLEV